MKYQYLIWVFLVSVIMITTAGSFLPDSYYSTEVSGNAFKREGEFGDLRHGTVKNYDENGKLKTIVNYEKGKKEGDSFIYYENGQIQLKMPYKNDERDGVGIKYYKSGQIYARTPYKNDKVNGLRTLYYVDGTIKAKINYKKNMPQLGLEEFYTNGQKKYHTTPAVIVQRKQGKLELSVNVDCRSTNYYLGELLDDKFFTDRDDFVEPIPQKGNKGFIDLRIYTPSYVNMLNIICKCVTTQGNPLIIKNNYQIN